MTCKRGQSPWYLRLFRSSNNKKFPANAPRCPGRGGGGGRGFTLTGALPCRFGRTAPRTAGAAAVCKVVIPKWRRNNSSHSFLFLVREHRKGNFTNFENSYKINVNSYNDIFFALVIRRKSKFMLTKKTFWGYWHFKYPDSFIVLNLLNKLTCKEWFDFVIQSPSKLSWGISSCYNLGAFVLKLAYIAWLF